MYTWVGIQKNGEMMFVIHSKSKIDKRKVMMYINENGGGFACNNVEDLLATIKMGENVVHLAVGLDGRGGYTDLRDKYGYVRVR